MHWDGRTAGPQWTEYHPRDSTRRGGDRGGIPGDCGNVAGFSGKNTAMRGTHGHWEFDTTGDFGRISPDNPTGVVTPDRTVTRPQNAERHTTEARSQHRFFGIRPSQWGLA
jgi:hypothetical protein